MGEVARKFGLASRREDEKWTVARVFARVRRRPKVEKQYREDGW